MSKNIILELYKRPETVFTYKELSLLFPDLKSQTLKNKLRYAVKTGKIRRVLKGIYAKENFDKFELANKIYSPSYISLETVLLKEGVIFQVTNEITLVSYLSRRVNIKGLKIVYRKIKDSVLTNHKGIVKEKNYFIATKERAFLDAVFLYKEYYFDNLKPLDWERVFSLVEIYESKALKKRVDEYYKLARA